MEIQVNYAHVKCRHTHELIYATDCYAHWKGCR